MSTACEQRPHEWDEDEERSAATGAPLLRPGHNCWRVERAERFYGIQDAADYFRLVRQAILQARDTIFIVGWDIQATLDLLPVDASAHGDGAGAGDAGADAGDGAGADRDSRDDGDRAPTRLNELLKWVVHRRPRLRCDILIWDHAALYTLERDPFTRWRLGWRMPRRVRFGFDDHHPIGGAHHQKLVVIDDALAFSGGIDLTGHRWDTPAHRVHEPARVNANGTPYGPYHEVQAMVQGPIAAALGALVRDRWRALGEPARPRPPANARAGTSSEAASLWPKNLEPDLIDVDVAIARTMPPSERDPGARECEQLFLDSIAAARRSIYIESQYFTDDALGRALAARLQEPDGPEVIVVVPKDCHGWLEQQTMCVLRDQVLREIVAADHHRRLRVVQPVASRAADVSTFVHSKVMVVDDGVVRIGSANFSRRSMGLDSECDLAAVAGNDSRHRAGVQGIRDRLIGEHLAMAREDVAAELARLGSLRALIDAHAHAGSTMDRALLSIELRAPAGPAEPPTEILKAAADPEAPIEIAAGLADLIPPLDARADRGSLGVWLPVVAIGLALIVADRLLTDAHSTVAHALREAPRMPSIFGIGLGVLLLAHAALIPLELLALLAGLVLGGFWGALVAVAGAWIAAVAGYGIGRAIGMARLASLVGRRAYRSVRHLGARGAIGVAVLRMSSIASSSAVHLLCGAGKVPFGAYLAGSIGGLTPIVLVASGLGSLIRAALFGPSWSTGLTAAAGILGVCVLGFAVRSVLLVRQFAPSVRRHRQRAEFG